VRLVQLSCTRVRVAHDGRAQAAGIRNNVRRMPRAEGGSGGSAGKSKHRRPFKRRAGADGKRAASPAAAGEDEEEEACMAGAKAGADHRRSMDDKGQAQKQAAGRKMTRQERELANLAFVNPGVNAAVSRWGAGAGEARTEGERAGEARGLVRHAQKASESGVTHAQGRPRPHGMDDERRKKGSVGAAGAPAGHQGVVTQGVSAKVLNQGGHGTCVGYAVSLVMTTALHEIHGIACDPEKLVEKVKALCPCWEGHETERMLGQWNKKHAKPGAAIEDVDQRQRYNVMVQYTKITSFEEARTEMERQEALKLLMPCTISTGQQGHKLHAVALRGTAPGGKMEAVNSWGANQSLLEITPANFCYAIRFDPVITAAAKSGGVQIAIPPVRSMFSARVQEQDDKRKKAEQAKRDEVEKAGLLDAIGVTTRRWGMM